MVKTKDAIGEARRLLGTPYSELDCINLIKKVIRTSPGGVPGYTTAGTNALWNSQSASGKYRDLTWTQDGLYNPKAGMLAFKKSGNDVHHVGLVTERGTVIHSSSTAGKVVETELDSSWQLLAIHRYIAVAGKSDKEQEIQEETTMPVSCQAVVRADPRLRLRAKAVNGKIIGYIPNGETVDILENGEWPRVRYGDSVGYVSGEFLEYLETDQEVAEAVETDEENVFTTLVSLDGGAMLRISGRWRVAED